MKKGFTLIELLAVIVILAIIALIATPIVLNIINDTKESANLRSADFYLDALELSIAQSVLENKNITDATYNILENGNLCLEYAGTTCSYELEVEVNGETPTSGEITITNGNISGIDINLGNKRIVKNSLNELVYEESILCTAIEPVEQPLYIGGGLWENTLVGIQATTRAPYASGSVYKCNLGDGDRNFYVLNEEVNNVKLIMDRNIGDKVEWINNKHFLEAGGDQTDFNNYVNLNVWGPITATEYLNDETSGWTDLFDKKGSVSLPSYDDLNPHKSQGWLRVNLAGDIYSYWTSTAYKGIDNALAYMVHYDSSLTSSYTPVNIDSDSGVRPMITISKENIGF